MFARALLQAVLCAMEPQVQKEMQELLQSQQGVNVKLTKILELLTTNGLAYQSCLKVTDLLCHPDNRGGSMVQAHDCWKKGSLILASGLKKSLLLASSMCIEMGKGYDPMSPHKVGYLKNIRKTKTNSKHNSKKSRPGRAKNRTTQKIIKN